MTLPAQSLPDDATEVDSDEDPPQRETPFALTFLAVIGVGALIVILCVLGAAFSGLSDLGSGTTAPPAQGPGPTDAPPATSMADGQWLVGADIQPGSYSVTVVNGSPGCTWERAASTDGAATAILESGVGQPGQTLVVGIRDTDAVFQSRDCGVWERVGD